MGCRELHTCVRLMLLSDFFRLNLCWRIWDDSIFLQLIGQLLAEKVDTERVQCCLHGFTIFMHNAVRPVWLSFSNSGEVFARVKRGVCLTGELIASFPNVRKRPCPALPHALLCWKDWLLPKPNYGLVELPPKAVR